MLDIKVIVASHKKYQMPEDRMYLPVQVGSALHDKIGYQCDDAGDNISEKNPYFCELTGLYWAWKNIVADAIGLVHYRRHFGKSRNRLLDFDTAAALLERYDAILPKKRKYYIENLYSHYVNTLEPKPLEETGRIIREKYPDYYPEFERLKKRTDAHMFNMMIMKKGRFDEYCSWLFDILFELEKRVPTDDMDSFHARFFGRVSELLLDVWINTNGVSYTEYPFVYMEKVNKFKKGMAFLKAKFFKTKYNKSF